MKCFCDDRIDQMFVEIVELTARKAGLRIDVMA